MCSGTLGVIRTDGKDKALDGIRVQVTHVGQWRLVVMVTQSTGVFSRGDSFYLKREYFYPKNK